MGRTLWGTELAVPRTGRPASSSAASACPGDSCAPGPGSSPPHCHQLPWVSPGGGPAGLTCLPRGLPRGQCRGEAHGRPSEQNPLQQPDPPGHQLLAAHLHPAAAVPGPAHQRGRCRGRETQRAFGARLGVRWLGLPLWQCPDLCTKSPIVHLVFSTWE